MKGKFLPITGHIGPDRNYRYTSTLSLILTLDRGGWLTPRPGRLSPGKETKCPFYRTRVSLGNGLDV